MPGRSARAGNGFGQAATGSGAEVNTIGGKAVGSRYGRVMPGNQATGKEYRMVTAGERADGNNGSDQRGQKERPLKMESILNGLFN